MIRNRCCCFFALLLFVSVSLLGCAEYATSIHVHGNDCSYVLHVPASELQVILPSGGFVRKDPRQVGGSDSPRYFYFEDSARRIIISGWFEPEKAFPGIRQLWERDTRSFKEKGLADPLNVAFEKIGTWDTVIYDMPNAKFTNSHVRAQWVQKGTWIDLHLSVAVEAPSSTARSALLEVLRAIRVEEY